MALMHLIVGNVGAGKSTLAAEIEREAGAHVFSVDDWMATLFWMDSPDPPEYAWALERTERIESQILNESWKLLRHGSDVVLDLGFFSRLQRKRVLDAVRLQSAHAAVHYLDVDADTRWRRVSHRNEAKTETYRITVSREMFDFCETLFEPVADDELPSDVPLRRYG